LVLPFPSSLSSRNLVVVGSLNKGTGSQECCVNQ
jgi:hypothetical protein